MRLTKIHWKRFSRPVLSGAFFAAGIAAAIYFREPVQLPPIESVASFEKKAESFTAAEIIKQDDELADKSQPPKSLTPVRDRYADWVVSGHVQMGAKQTYLLRSPEGQVVSLDNLTAKGVDVYPVDNCSVKIVSTTDVSDWVSIFARVCTPQTVGRPALAAESIPAKPLAKAEYVPDSRLSRVPRYEPPAKGLTFAQAMDVTGR